MQHREKVSAFGKYQGYTEAEFDGYKRMSDYLLLPDGGKLAYDLLLPTKRSAPASHPLPVLFKYTPYLRTFTIFDEKGRNIIAGLFKLKAVEKALLRLRYWLSSEKGRFMDPVFRTKWLKTMLAHGYAVVVVERPGTGASFGIMDPTMEVGGREASEVIDWIAEQKWCDGNIGMFGDSFQAMIQFAAAAQGNKNLKAIMPASSYMNGYEAIMNPGGIYNKSFGSFFKWAVDFMESDVISPVDRDLDGSLLAAARADRKATLGTKIIDGAIKFPYRDDLRNDGEYFWKTGGDLYPFLDRINASKIAVYLSVGWYDLFTEDMFLWYENLSVPKRLTVRPIDHSGADQSGPDLDYAAEALRWFDHWLKGVDNGIMNELPLHYFAMGSPRHEAWKAASRWPIAEAKMTDFFVAPNAGGSVREGSLATTEPEGTDDAADEVIVDYSTTTGKKSRWTAVNWEREYPDMRGNDEKGLSYTTSPLLEDTRVTGIPFARIWMSTDATELDLFVYLEEVDPKGGSTYVTEGKLRVAHRKLGEAPYSNFGLPFHTHYRADLEPIPAGVPIFADLALLPTSYLFTKGNRIRVAITFADADNFETLVISPKPRVSILRDGGHQSLIKLPLATK